MTTPIYVLTGFLGSGKTTLLKKLLEKGGMRDTIVLVNELGEIAIDHLVVREITEEVVLLRSGCLCCSVRDDLSETLIDLYHRRAAGELPPFDRVVVETTGLADPTPVILTLMSDDWLTQHYALKSLITTVDANLGEAQLDRHDEALKQAALAECIVITKVDLVCSTAVDALTVRLNRVNPDATIAYASISSCPGLDVLINTEDFVVPLDNRGAKLGPQVDATEEPRGEHPLQRIVARRHDSRITSFCLVSDDVLDWDSFVDWLNLLLINRGRNILRVKGLVGLYNCPGPVLVQGVQHIFYPPAYLSAWPSIDHRSRLVFITDALSGTAIASSLGEFQPNTRIALL